MPITCLTQRPNNAKHGYYTQESVKNRTPAPAGVAYGKPHMTKFRTNVITFSAFRNGNLNQLVKVT